MSKSHYGGEIGYHQNPLSQPRDRDLKVGCSACGASKGSKCRGRDGAALTKTHSVRSKAAKGAQLRAMCESAINLAFISHPVCDFRPDREESNGGNKR